MVIDFHAHLFNRNWLPEKFWSDFVSRTAAMKKLGGQSPDTNEITREMFAAFEDPEGEVLLEEMRTAGIHYTLIMPLDLGLELSEAGVSIEEKNRLIADIVRHHPQQLGAFCGVDPRRPTGLNLFEKAVKEWGMRGLKLDPASGFYPNDPLVYPYYEKACELGVPVLCHTGAAIPPFRNKYCDPIHLDDVTLDFPELTVIAAHAGFGWWQQTAFLISKKVNLLADISGWQTVAARDYGLFCRYFRDFLSIAGAQNVLFATDGPAFRIYGLNNREWVDLIKSLPEKSPAGIEFSSSEIEAVLSQNACRVLGLPLSEP